MWVRVGDLKMACHEGTLPTTVTKLLARSHLQEKWVLGLRALKMWSLEGKEQLLGASSDPVCADHRKRTVRPGSPLPFSIHIWFRTQPVGSCRFQ